MKKIRPECLEIEGKSASYLNIVRGIYLYRKINDNVYERIACIRRYVRLGAIGSGVKTVEYTRMKAPYDDDYRRAPKTLSWAAIQTRRARAKTYQITTYETFEELMERYMEVLL